MPSLNHTMKRRKITASSKSLPYPLPNIQEHPFSLHKSTGHVTACQSASFVSPSPVTWLLAAPYKWQLRWTVLGQIFLPEILQLKCLAPPVRFSSHYFTSPLEKLAKELSQLLRGKMRERYILWGSRQVLCDRHTAGSRLNTSICCKL